MKTKLTLLLLLSLFMVGCQLGITGSGVGKTENRTVDDFDSVSLSGTGDVILQVGQPKSVDATASGVGDVEVYGNPADVKQHASGIGSVTIKQ